MCSPSQDGRQPSFFRSGVIPHEVLKCATDIPSTRLLKLSSPLKVRTFLLASPSVAPPSYS